MALRQPVRTSWRWREVRGCFAAHVWDLETGRLVSFAEASRRQLGPVESGSPQSS